MRHALSLAAVLAAGLVLPAFAGDTTVKAPPAAEATTGPAMQNLLTSDQARQHLIHLGYTNVSVMEKDTNGKWVGTATKDGKTGTVAVDVKGPVTAK